jgi:MFS family permease
MPLSTARVAALGLLAVLILVPVTLPVAILRELVHLRFGVSEALTSLFMSVNMLGAVVAAPIVGALADRHGRRRELVAASLLLDGALLYALSLPVSFPVFMLIRFAEGCAHIAALSLLLGVAANARTGEGRGWVMGLVGGGITLGVALGAGAGAALATHGVLVPLRAGAGIVTLAALVAWLALRESEGGEARPELREIASAIREAPVLLVPLSFSFIDRFTVGFYTTTFSLYVARIFELEPSRRGLLIVAFMLPFALLSFPFGRLSERSSRVVMLGAGSVAYGIGTAVLPWLPLEWLALAMGTVGVCAAVMFVPSLLLTQELAPAAVRTTAMGAFNAAGSLGFIVGPIAGGVTSELVASQLGWLAGYRAAFGVAGASVLICVAATLPALRAAVARGVTR